jgi:rhodanese-related sulfurtransferase
VPKEAFRGAVRRLVVEGGARLVEVLPRQEYEDAHLRGAINIPLKELNRETTAGLDRAAQEIVYCHDYL